MWVMLLQEFNARLSHGYFMSIKNQRDAIRRHVDDPCTAKHRTWVVTGIKKDGTAAKRWYKLTFVSESGLYAFWTVAKYVTAPFKDKNLLPSTSSTCLIRQTCVEKLKGKRTLSYGSSWWKMKRIKKNNMLTPCFRASRVPCQKIPNKKSMAQITAPCPNKRKPYSQNRN